MVTGYAGKLHQSMILVFLQVSTVFFMIMADFYIGTEMKRFTGMRTD